MKYGNISDTVVHNLADRISNFHFRFSDQYFSLSFKKFTIFSFNFDLDHFVAFRQLVRRRLEFGDNLVAAKILLATVINVCLLLSHFS
jgi:hypothetical protein